MTNMTNFSLGSFCLGKAWLPRMRFRWALVGQWRKLIMIEAIRLAWMAFLIEWIWRIERHELYLFNADMRLERGRFLIGHQRIGSFPILRVLT